MQSSSQNVTTNKPIPSFFTGRMSFLSPNQQHKCTKEITLLLPLPLPLPLPLLLPLLIHHHHHQQQTTTTTNTTFCFCSTKVFFHLRLFQVMPGCPKVSPPPGDFWCKNLLTGQIPNSVKATQKIKLVLNNGRCHSKRHSTTAANNITYFLTVNPVYIADQKKHPALSQFLLLMLLRHALVC